MRDTKTGPEKVVKAEAEWMRELSPEQFSVTRLKATERPFSGKYNDCKTPGTYHCVCCGQALFGSGTKFDSGSGWPSFTAPDRRKRGRHRGRRQPRHAPRRGALRALRRAPGPRLRRRPGSHGPALLHELGRLKTPARARAGLTFHGSRIATTSDPVRP